VSSLPICNLCGFILASIVIIELLRLPIGGVSAYAVCSHRQSIERLSGKTMLKIRESLIVILFILCY
jgi:hypothetical protein